MSVIVGPRCNRRVTCDSSALNDRSESSIAVNPLDAYNLVGSSKRFTNPSTYAFSLAAYATFDGGKSWIDSGPLPLLAGWAGCSDPSVAWDNAGNAYVAALPFGPGSATDATGPVIGIAMYKSSDGGRSWGLPTLIHSSGGDDKQWAAGDWNPTSPYFGRVYVVWDGGNLLFARTTNQGATWIGTGASAAGSSIAPNSFAPSICVARDGTIYVAWISGTTISFVKSADGGNSFSAPSVVASGVTPLDAAGLSAPNGFPELPGGVFRVETLPSIAVGTGHHLVVTWADYRDGVSRIYYRHSTNGGTSWAGAASGQKLLTGAVASGAGLHDFHPQLATTPAGEIGCSFYEFGPRPSGGGTTPPLIDVVLAVSTDNGATFPNRATVTDTPWDPTVDAPLSHGTPSTTFIGDYFGLTASKLGFFPLWTDTRTGVQELFTSRLAVNPTDVFIRDSSQDTGAVPSPGNHWEAPDLIVRRQPDGATTFANEDLLRDGVTDHYIYGRVKNVGSNTARAVRLSVVVGNYPSLIGLPGAEFRYPQDWYKADWDATLALRPLDLGETAPANLASGLQKILGPVVWPAAQIPDEATWHPCLLAEVRTDNDDSAGGVTACDIPADPDPCAYGAYFWGNNNVCQRNLTYAPVPLHLEKRIEFPFVIGSPWSRARFIEVIVDKGEALAETPMTLVVEPIDPERKLRPATAQTEYVLVDGGRVVIREGNRQVAEILGYPGTILRPGTAGDGLRDVEMGVGAAKIGNAWRLTHARAAVGLPVAPGEMRRVMLSFTTSNTLKAGTRPRLRIFQRNDRRITTGGVILELEVARTRHVREGEKDEAQGTRRSQGSRGSIDGRR